MRRVGALGVLSLWVFAHACASSSDGDGASNDGGTGGFGAVSGADGSAASGGTGGTGGQSTAGAGGVDGGLPDGTINTDGQMGDPFCDCAPGLHNERIIVLSDDAELWSFDPVGLSFEKITDIECAQTQRTFSLAVDPIGRAWVLFLESEDIQMVDVNDPLDCMDPGYRPGAGFGLFGLTFAANSDKDACVQTYLHSYSGNGPFAEGPDAGTLGVMDPRMPTPTSIGPIDFDGGELAGTGDGRLFAFAGPDPAKLIEYDKATGAEIGRLTLDGFSKTNASAFAFFEGDIYFFTEATPLECDSCIARTCQSDIDACRASSACNEELQCAFAQFDITDECGGSLPQPVVDCVFSTCVAECFPAVVNRNSKVTKLDFDNSEGMGQVLEVVVPEAPIRIAGADSSTCVPFQPVR